MNQNSYKIVKKKCENFNLILKLSSQKAKPDKLKQRLKEVHGLFRYLLEITSSEVKRLISGIKFQRVPLYFL